MMKYYFRLKEGGKMTGIYKIENIINHKVYIGQSVLIETRWSAHRGRLNRGKMGKHPLQQSWTKYGENNFSFSVLEECSADELDEREIYYISLYNSTNRKFGYNIESGGACKFHGTPLHDYEQNIIDRFKNSNTFLHIDEIIDSHKKNLKQVDMSDKRIVLLNTGEIFDGLHQAWLAYNFVDKSGIAKCCKNKLWSAGKINGEPLFWVYYSEFIKMSKEDIKFRMNKTKLIGITTGNPIICLNNGKIFESYIDAQEYCGVGFQTLWSACNGKGHTAGEDPITHERLVWRKLNKDIKDTLSPCVVHH